MFNSGKKIKLLSLLDLWMSVNFTSCTLPPLFSRHFVPTIHACQFPIISLAPVPPSSILFSMKDALSKCSNGQGAGHTVFMTICRECSQIQHLGLYKGKYIY